MCGAPLWELSGSGRLRETDSLSESKGSGERELGGGGGGILSKAMPLGLVRSLCIWHTYSNPVPSRPLVSEPLQREELQRWRWRGAEKVKGRKMGGGQARKKANSKDTVQHKGHLCRGPGRKTDSAPFSHGGKGCVHRPPPTTHLTTRIRKKKKNRPRLC